MKSDMPAQKADWIEVLTRRDPTLSRAASTYDGYFAKLGVQWAGGKNRSDRQDFRACFGLDEDKA